MLALLCRNTLFVLFVLFVFVGVMGLLGCANPKLQQMQKQWGKEDWREVSSGVIVTPGVEIQAKDGSFKLASGKSFKPPFRRKCLVAADASNFMTAINLGAKNVRVRVPGLPQPLFGILTLCYVHKEATGPATRSYQIQIPDEYIKATEGGRVSVVFEETNWQGLDAWQLWLSRVQMDTPQARQAWKQQFEQCLERLGSTSVLKCLGLVP